MLTIVDVLRNRAEQRSTDQAFLFIDEFMDEGATWASYADIDLAARKVAAALTRAGARGQPVLLLYPPGRAYVEGFLGCLYAGAIAVPAYPPDPMRLERTLPRLRALVADCGAHLALSTSALAEAAQDLPIEAPELTALQWLATDDLPEDLSWVPIKSASESIAFLQYTSGSTGTPRGVMLTHANLMHNLELIRNGFSATPEDVGVSWLPPYHDMGLIGGILQPIYTGLPLALMSPLAFLQRPMMWLETISQLSATISGGPNFAFDLCVRKSSERERAQLDLSRWRLAFCGAEPVRPETLDRFAAAFAPAGFRREAFYPCYGLAEATLIVTGGRSHGTVGKVLGDQRLAIVDPATGSVCPAGTVGEIWVSGPSVAQGYLNRPQETDQTFHARLAGDHERRYLRTGDLGFADPDGGLVVTGRAKDLIIVRGRNIYPQDLEQAVEHVVSGVRPGCSAAYQREDGVGFACEVRPDAAPMEVIAAIRQVLAETCEVNVSTVVLLRAGRIPKTSSGKIQRHACQDLTSDVVARWDEPSLASLVVGALGVGADAVPEDEPLTRLGLDSLRAVELRHELMTRAGVSVSLSELLSGATLAQLRQRSTVEPEIAGPAEIVDEGEHPASDGQRALWFVQRWAPFTTAYQITRAARITSELDVDALERAFQALVARHPALRTCLPARGGEPVQRVFRWDGPVVARHDACGLDDDTLLKLVQAEADRPFDLERGPLFRVALFSRGDRDHVLLLSLHHTITDFWSLSVMVDELLTLYTGGQVAALTPHPMGNPMRTEAVDERRLEYWRGMLQGAPHLELPTTFPRPRLQSFRGARHRFRVHADILRQLDAFAHDNGVTRFVALLAGFMAVLSRYAGEDVVVGVPTAGRGDPQRVGYFVVPAPIRARVRPDMTFRDLVAQVRDAVLGALDHAVPFPRLVEALSPVRDPSRPVLMQAMMVLHQPPAGRSDLAAFAVADETAGMDLSGLEVRALRLAEHGAAFDLSLVLADVGGVLSGVVEYCADLFDQPAMGRLGRHLSTMLAQATAHPDASIEALELMEGEERARVLAFGMSEPVPFSDQTTLHALLAAQTARRPHATALVCEERSLTYAELDERASRLAGLLRARFGVQREKVVGVQLERGLDAIVAFWAVLKAGGIYLPLEPRLPAARLEWMLADAEPAVVITEELLTADLSDVDTVLDSGTGPDDIAYIIYTSGSTGRPKGVPITHRGACNLGESLGAACAVTEADRMLQYASCAFDASIAEILIAHLHGAALHVTPRRAVTPGPELVRLLTEQRITAAILTPSTLAALPDAELPDLVRLLAGGEACSAELVARWAPLGSQRRFLNAYGPTEVSVCATWTVCEPDGGRPSIGRPMANVYTYVLDGAMRPVPIGVPGELYIGGVGVAPGYLNRPDLTAERFVHDPFSSTPGARMYRSGDRVRWLPDGTLDFLGRLDDQVKIGGVRIEPGEIEARLRDLLGIREVAVVPRSRPDGVELVAYLVAAERTPVAQLRDLLRTELPGPWVPAAFVYLDAMPRNPSGKLDRHALPQPVPADRGISGHVAARTPMEATIAQIWAAVLGHDMVGVKDHFFEELGGSSLLVAKVTSELSQRLGREVPVTHLFEHPTVEALARRLQQADTMAHMAQESSAAEDVALARRRALAARATRERSGNHGTDRQ